MTNSFRFFLSFMFDLSKYAQILAIVWRTVVEIFCLILVYVYKCTCFFLLHHIDIYEQRKLNYSDNLILLDFKKGNSGPYNFFSIFSNDCWCYCFQQCTRYKLKECCSHLFFKIIIWWIIEQNKGIKKISGWTRLKAYTVHSYFPLYEYKREFWRQS